MNLEQLYFSHTITDTSCPICNSKIDRITKTTTRSTCSKCYFTKFTSGFNVYVNNVVYIFNFKSYDLNLPLDILNDFSNYTQLINYILKLQVFK